MNKENYGFIFNEIVIKDNKFIKKSKNIEGKNKLNNEILFYNYIKNNNIPFSIPTIIYYEDGKIEIEYLSNYKTLTECITDHNVIDIHIKNILNFLKIIHDVKKEIDIKTLMNDIEIETNIKIVNRYNKFNWELNEIFNKIKFVNKLKINNIHYYIDSIQKKCIHYLKERKYYNLIHGDPHLGNIMIKDTDYKFIDPRGIFGDTKLFGLKEYDYAKLLFGLSGYSKFDTMKITEIDIINNNLNIEFIKEYENMFYNNNFDNLTKLLCLSIWLGNNSCFIDENKKIISLTIALYYCEKFINIL